MAAVSRQPPLDRRRREAPPADLKAAVDLRSGRVHRILRRDFGGTVYVGRPTGELHRHRPRHRQAALEVQGAGGHRRIVSRGRRRRRLHRRPRGPAARRPRRGRQAAVDVQDRGRNQVVARRCRRPRADRLVRRQPVLPRRRDGKLRWKYTPRTSCTPRRRSKTASSTSAAATRSSARSAVATARCCSFRWRVHRGIARDRAANAPTSAPSETTWWPRPAHEEDRSGATAIPSASFPFYSSAAALGDGAHRARRPRQAGPRLNAKTGKPFWTFPTRARVDSSPAIAGGRVYIGSNDGQFYVLDAAPARSSGISKPARRSPPRPRSPMAGS